MGLGQSHGRTDLGDVPVRVQPYRTDRATADSAPFTEVAHPFVLSCGGDGVNDGVNDGVGDVKANCLGPDYPFTAEFTYPRRLAVELYGRSKFQVAGQDHIDRPAVRRLLPLVRTLRSPTRHHDVFVVGIIARADARMALWGAYTRTGGAFVLQRLWLTYVDDPKRPDMVFASGRVPKTYASHDDLTDRWLLQVERWTGRAHDDGATAEHYVQTFFTCSAAPPVQLHPTRPTSNLQKQLPAVSTSRHKAPCAICWSRSNPRSKCNHVCEGCASRVVGVGVPQCPVCERHFQTHSE